jgi:hypothetical protein
MSLKVQEHRSGTKIIPAYIQDEVKTAITNSGSLDRGTSARTDILRTLRNKHGWSDETTLSADAKISIPARKGEIALCVQTGNMGRFYADLMKLEYLFNEQMIKGAVYVLPLKGLAKEWGQNIANFERFTNEVKIFSKILHTPLVIFGIQKK